MPCFHRCGSPRCMRRTASARSAPAASASVALCRQLRVQHTAVTRITTTAPVLRLIDVVTHRVRNLLKRRLSTQVSHGAIGCRQPTAGEQTRQVIQHVVRGELHRIIECADASSPAHPASGRSRSCAQSALIAFSRITSRPSVQDEASHTTGGGHRQ